MPEPPVGLGEPGVRLWTSVAGEFVLNAGELEILRQACRTSDEITSLEAELRASSLVVAGYAGQPRPNPLLKIIQDHRLLLRRLVDSLALPDEAEESGLRPGQRHARTAAQGRWKGHVPNGKVAELRGEAS
ncbi:MAG TPA: hypothetical protein VI094_18435 [Propionibacteriaceae bacterium]